MQVEASPLWPHNTDFPKLAGDIKVDVAIVGGGIAGISSAFFLGLRGYKVALVESEQIASAATGASSGTLFYGSETDFQESIKRYGIDSAKALFSETKSGIEFMIDLIKKENISCGLREPGIIFAAKNEAEAAYLEKEQETAKQFGINGKILDSNEIANVFKGKQFISGAEYYCGQIHPGQFVGAISQIINPRFGVQIYENTPMLSYSDNGASAIVKTENGSIKADKVIVATNIKPFYGLEKHFFVENSTVIPSKHLGDRVKEIMPVDKIIETLEEKYDIMYLQEGRLFLELYSAKGAQEKIKEYFPSWVEFDINGQWGDSWSKTKDMLPIVGHVTSNIIAQVAMGDQGIVMGFTTGRRMADIIEKKSDPFIEMLSPKRFG